MLERRQLFATAAGLLALPGLAAAQESLVPIEGSPAERAMLAPGPQMQALAARAGVWDMVQTSWSAPGAAPVTTTGFIAERQMVGPFLQEVVRPGPKSPASPFRRLDYLTFNRIEGRWDYASMDTRAANGIMPAWSLGPDSPERIFVVFQPFALAGSGTEITGQMMRMEQVITFDGPDRDVKDQFFALSDGAATKWQVRRYSYTRRPT